MLSAVLGSKTAVLVNPFGQGVRMGLTMVRPELLCIAVPLEQPSEPGFHKRMSSGYHTKTGQKL